MKLKMSVIEDKLHTKSGELITNNENNKFNKEVALFCLEPNSAMKTPMGMVEEVQSKSAINSQCTLFAKKLSPGTLYGDCEVKTSIKSSLSTLEKLSLFNLAKKKLDQKSVHSAVANIKEKSRFAKSHSLTRLLGNTYNTKKCENNMVSGDPLKKKTTSGNPERRFNNAERFHKYSKEEEIAEDLLNDITEDKDLSAKAFRTISRSLGKLWWRKTHSIDISTPDPEYKVSYLGNVLTGWAKGEGCMEKPLNTLWRNYTQNHKPDVVMRVKICASGLKATTRQHGLTEYWANRITYCCAPQNYPKVFCWIYRHEGRKLKHELRCHAVLCSKESIAQEICARLRENLDQALRDFKREKLSKQNARLSLANAAYENPSLPRRKILLSVGGNNYRPPLERSKSAPKLMAIEEAIGEEEGEDCEHSNEPEMPSCCQKDSLYPAMTLGRRRCRRGHSIRRTGKLCKTDNLSYQQQEETTLENELGMVQPVFSMSQQEDTTEASQSIESNTALEPEDLEDSEKANSTSSLTSEEDDLENLLRYHNYDTNSPLAGELLSYFDTKIKPKTSSLSNLNETTIVFDPLLESDSKSRSSKSLEDLDDCNCDEAEYFDEYGHLPYSDDLFFRQHRDSLRKIELLSMNEDENISEPGKSTHTISSGGLCMGQTQQQGDSDEGSISSGCETASTITANLDESSLKYMPHCRLSSLEIHQGVSVELDKQPKSYDSYQKQTHPTSSSVCNKIITTHASFRLNRGKSKPTKSEGDISDSEFSDESGYVEFQEQHNLQRNKGVIV